MSDLGLLLFFPCQCLKVQLSYHALEKHVLVQLCMCVLSYLVCKVAVGLRPAACEALQQKTTSHTPHRILDTTPYIPTVSGRTAVLQCLSKGVSGMCFDFVYLFRCTAVWDFGLSMFPFVQIGQLNASHSGSVSALCIWFN